MRSDDEWVRFQSFPERGRAEALCMRLRAEGIAARIDAQALENAVEARYCVHVAKSLAHRARWIAAQLPPTDEELDFLAAGKLRGEP